MGPIHFDVWGVPDPFSPLNTGAGDLPPGMRASHGAVVNPAPSLTGPRERLGVIPMYGYRSLGSRNFIFRDREKFPYDNPRISKTQNFLKSSGYHRENSHGPEDFFSRLERSTGHTSKMYGAPYIENVWEKKSHTFLMYGVLVSRVTKFYFSGP